MSILALLLATTISGGSPAPAPMNGGIAERHPSGPVLTPPNPIRIDQGSPKPGVWRDMRDVRRQIDNARDTGTLSRRDARQFDREAGRIEYAARRYARDGLSDSEQKELEMRALALRDAISAKRTEKKR